MRGSSLLFAATVLGLTTVGSAAQTLDAREKSGTIYVSDLYGAQVVAFKGTKTSVISGSRTQLRDPIPVERQAWGDLVVANAPEPTHQIPGFIVTLPPGKGNVKARHVLNCSNLYPWAIALDASGNIWVANYHPGDPANAAIRVYAPNADGCPNPLMEISGDKTQLTEPLAVALDRKGRIVVLNLDNSVLVFKAGSSGNVAPIARIAGGATKLNHPEGMALDAAGNIYVANYDQNGSIVEFARKANGNVAPVRMIAGSNTRLGATIGLAIDNSTGQIYAANLNTHSVLVFAADADGDVAPETQLGSPLQGPSGIALPK